MATRGTKRGYKKQTNAKARGKFRSGLEVTMKDLLEEAGIKYRYEEEKFEIMPAFKSPNKSYEKFLNGKGDFIDRGNKSISKSVYTPDFLNAGEDLKWVIEVKGRAMPDFSRTWKLFKKKLVETDNSDVTLYVPRNKKDCIEVIKLIKEEFYNE